MAAATTRGMAVSDKIEEDEAMRVNTDVSREEKVEARVSPLFFLIKKS